MQAILVLAALGLGSPVVQATPVEPASTRGASCDVLMARAASANAMEMIQGASICFASHRTVEGSFLLVAGQIRSIADMTLMMPASRADSDVVTSLYGLIYFQAGGPGDEQVLRTPALREQFFRLLDSWVAEYSADYNPGWNVRRRPDIDVYRQALAESKAHRRQQLTDTARLLSDETYYSLHRRFEELSEQNQNQFVEGTPEFALSRELQQQMGERAAALGLADYAVTDQAPESHEPRFPPESPADEETILSYSQDPIAERCAMLAERRTIAEDSQVARVLVTRSPEWGVIWRADISGGNQPAYRFTCTETTSSSRPLELGEERLSPLPAGRAR